MKGSNLTAWAVLAVACVLLCAPPLEAQERGFVCTTLEVIGTITFKGGVTLDTADVGTANAVTSWITPTVESRDFDFATFVAAGAAVTMAAPWTFDGGGALPALWSVGGFTFNADPATVVFQSSIGLFVTAFGTITGNGFVSTPGVLNLTTHRPSADAKFSFSAGQLSFFDCDEDE